MKIIFLDIDGVLNNEWFYERRHECYQKGLPFTAKWPMNEIDPDNIERLNRAIAETGAKIVLTSTWRIGKTVESLSSLLRLVGVQGEVIGKTKTAVDKSVANNYLRQEFELKWVGQKVAKKSGKPFRFGGKVATVSKVLLAHPYNEACISFKIKEDDTYVESVRCYNVDTKEKGPWKLNELSFHDTKERGIEIAHWLDTTDLEVDGYVVLDDEADILECQKARFVQVDPKVGITDQDVVKITNILNINK